MKEETSHNKKRLLPIQLDECIISDNCETCSHRFHCYTMPKNEFIIKVTFTESCYTSNFKKA